MSDIKEFRPYIPSDKIIPEFTVKAVITGALFGLLFGAATVYLALKAGLTVSASIPIAVLAISLGKKFLKTNILENNIIQTTGSAGESVAAGVVFTLPAFLFLSPDFSTIRIHRLFLLQWLFEFSDIEVTAPTPVERLVSHHGLQMGIAEVGLLIPPYPSCDISYAVFCLK